MGNQHLVFERYLWFDAEIRKNRYPNASSLAAAFEISARTARRNIDFMRDMLGAPLAYDKSRKGYFYNAPYELPDLPLSQEEFLAVLLAGELIASADRGAIGRALASFGRKFFQKNSDLGISLPHVRRCFSAVWQGYSPSEAGVFRRVSSALLSSRPLFIRYVSPKGGAESEREVEPHHLQHYMGSWVLLAWCRLRRGWRRFYLSRIREAAVGDDTFRPRPKREWQHLVAGGFGVFQGDELVEVVVRFSPYAARWVREQVWHPSQRMEDTEDGGLVLRLPAADLREIKMKILQYGPEAEALAPEELRRMIAADARALAGVYRESEDRSRKTEDRKR